MIPTLYIYPTDLSIHFIIYSGESKGVLQGPASLPPPPKKKIIKKKSNNFTIHIRILPNVPLDDVAYTHGISGSATDLLYLREVYGHKWKSSALWIRFKINLPVIHDYATLRGYRDDQTFTYRPTPTLTLPVFGVSILFCLMTVYPSPPFAVKSGIMMSYVSVILRGSNLGMSHFVHFTFTSTTRCCGGLVTS